MWFSPSHAEILRNEVIAAVDRLAVAGDEEHEHVRRPHLAGKLGETASSRSRSTPASWTSVTSTPRTPLARLAQRLGQGFGIGHRIGELQFGIGIVVEADREHVEARRRAAGGAGR